MWRVSIEPAARASRWKRVISFSSFLTSPGADDLHGHAPPGRRVLGHVDRAQRTRAELVLDPILSVEGSSDHVIINLGGKGRSPQRGPVDFR